ncbi:hypothetical protein HYX12_01890 [Candidatus Woesearchaeota archaeon]|nr:hypothetical protein [Candidatus Woesearchaeota archaeon]
MDILHFFPEINLITGICLLGLGGLIFYVGYIWILVGLLLIMLGIIFISFCIIETEKEAMHHLGGH